MRIHVTYTGGTIGMIETPHGLAPGADMRGWLDHVLEGTQVTREQVTFTELSPLIDSSNATPENWQAIIDDLWANRDDADAFVVLHGTDTMSYTGAALSYALTEFGKPVILTGSQLPLGLIESDATANVTGALNAAVSGQARGVTLFFGHHLFELLVGIRGVQLACRRARGAHGRPLAMVSHRPHGLRMGEPRTLHAPRHRRHRHGARHHRHTR